MGCVKKVTGTALIVGVGVVVVTFVRRLAEREKQSREYADKMNSYYHILNHWLKLKQQGISCVDFFHENHIKRIAIYGFKELGERLYDELKNTDVEVVYIIDKNVDGVRAEIDIYGVDGDFPETDAIIVTPSYYFNEIEEVLQDKVKCPIISIEDVIL